MQGVDQGCYEIAGSFALSQPKMIRIGQVGLEVLADFACDFLVQDSGPGYLLDVSTWPDRVGESLSRKHWPDHRRESAPSD